VKLFKLPMILMALIALAIGLAVIARATGAWKLEATRGRPQQTVP
jgi:hypothetical protein